MTIIYVVAALLAVPCLALLVSPFFRKRFDAGGKILLLHALTPNTLDLSSLSLDRFDQLINLVRSKGFKIGAIEQANSDKSYVAITFDDGYDDLLQLIPELEKKALTFTVFVPTGHIGRSNDWDNFVNSGKRRHLDKSEIKRLSDLGVEFGSHSHSHVDLTSLSDSELERELSHSKRVLEEIVGKEIRYIAYPFGKWDKRVADCAVRVGYLKGLQVLPSDGVGFNLGRIGLHHLDNGFTFSAKLGASPWSGIEFIKNYVINRFSHLTPVVSKAKLLP